MKGGKVVEEDEEDIDDDEDIDFSDDDEDFDEDEMLFYFVEKIERIFIWN